MLKGGVAVTVIALASASGALAGAQAECGNETLPPDRAIIACSQVVKDNPRATSAYFHTVRGLAYKGKGDSTALSRAMTRPLPSIRKTLPSTMSRASPIT